MKCPIDHQPTTARIGEILGHRYRLDGVVGRCDGGTLYFGAEVRLRYPVAVLVLDEVLGRDALAKVCRVAGAANHMGHSSIVRTLDLGVAGDGKTYIVHEPPGGRHLVRVLGAAGPTSLDIAVRIALGLCNVLAAAHAARIVHGALSTRTLFVVPRASNLGYVRVLGFGLGHLGARRPEPVADVSAVARIVFDAIAGSNATSVDAALDTLPRGLLLALAGAQSGSAVPPSLCALREALEIVDGTKVLTLPPGR